MSEESLKKLANDLTNDFFKVVMSEENLKMLANDLANELFEDKETVIEALEKGDKQTIADTIFESLLCCE